MERVKSGAKDSDGVTHRADAMRDENGRAIPASEFIIVDDEAPIVVQGEEVGKDHFIDDEDESQPTT